MNTRTRTYTHSETEQDLRAHNHFDLDAYTDDELEALLFDEEELQKKSKPGVFNLPTMAGLSMILVGIVYLLQEMGMGSFFDLSPLVTMLPVFAGILIILMGFGVLSWRPQRKQKRRKAKATSANGIHINVKPPTLDKLTKKRITKSRNKKIAGVAAGLAEYFNLDPTIVRIAFVVGAIASSGFAVPLYIALAVILPQPETMTLEERITIIRDS